MAQYVFTMNRLGKVVPPKRQILKGISLRASSGMRMQPACNERIVSHNWPWCGYTIAAFGNAALNQFDAGVSVHAGP